MFKPLHGVARALRGALPTFRWAFLEKGNDNMTDDVELNEGDCNDEYDCEGHFEGQGSICLSGRIQMNCDCCKLRTRTQIIQVPPQTETSFDGFLQAQVDAVENAGKLVLAHSIVDAGAGWIVGLTVGEYV